MINTHGKLLLTAFMVIILGLVLIQAIADGIKEVSVSSITVTNETLAFALITSDIVNQSLIMTNGTTHNLTGTLAPNDNLTVLTEIRNTSMQIVTDHCNITLASGALTCNHTGYPALLYFDYTYISGRSETLSQDDILSLDAIRNATTPSADMIGHCNITLSTGGLICNNTHYQTGYADYKYEPDDYVGSTTAATILTITILFFALAILAIGIGYAWKSFKESNLM